MPTVTCVMPAYNAEKYITEAIEGILNQTYNDFEFIIIDDGSSDNTPNIIEEYANKDGRIVYLANEENKGVSYTRNRGLAAAKGKYIAIMDADDIAHKERFQKQVDYMEENEDIGALGSAMLIVTRSDENGQVVVMPETDNEIRLYALSGSPIANPTAMIRKSVIDKNNLRYDEEYDGAEDYEFWQRMLKFTQFHNLQELFLKHRIHDKNTSSSKKNVDLTLKIINKALKEIVAEEFYAPLLENPEDNSPAAIRETFRIVSEIPLMILNDDCPFTRSELATAATSQREYLLDTIIKDNEVIV